jgi:putative Holliday junction resolvase
VRYLGLDVGERWIGLALGDSASGLSSPLRTLRRSSRKAVLEVIRRICDTERVETIVVGLPHNMNGSIGPQAQLTLDFAATLSALNLPVAFCDERLSSAAAEEYVTATRGRSLRPGERVDHVAAAIILQDYLDESAGGR